MDLLRVSSKSTPSSVAGAIASIVREKECVGVQAIGAGATNQAVKSIAIARGYLCPVGIDMVCVPEFSNVNIDGIDRTAMTFVCFRR